MALDHAKPNKIVDLAPLGSAITNAVTAAITKTEQFEVIHLIVLASKEIPQHKVSGEISLHCLEGHVEIGLKDNSVNLKANEWLYLEGGTQHSVKSVQDSSLLLTIMFTR